MKLSAKLRNRTDARRVRPARRLYRARMASGGTDERFHHDAESLHCAGLSRNRAVRWLHRTVLSRNRTVLSRNRTVLSRNRTVLSRNRTVSSFGNGIRFCRKAHELLAQPIEREQAMSKRSFIQRRDVASLTWAWPVQCRHQHWPLSAELSGPCLP